MRLVSRPARKVVVDYLRRWAIELLIRTRSSIWGWALTASCGTGL